MKKNPANNNDKAIRRVTLSGSESSTGDKRPPKLKKHQLEQKKDQPSVVKKSPKDKGEGSKSARINFAAIKQNIASVHYLTFIKKHIKLLVVLLLLITCCLVFWLAPWFRFKERVVEGNIFLESANILQVADLSESEHFLSQFNLKDKAALSFRYPKAEQRLLNFYPELKSAKVQFLFPGELHITVEERVPIASIEYQNYFYKFDGEGVVIAKLQDQPIDVPTIKGITMEPTEVGEQIKTSQVKDLNKAIALMAEMILADSQTQADFNLPDLMKIISLQADGTVNIDMEYHGSKLKVIAMHTNYLRENFDRLKRILIADYLKKYGDGTLDITGKNLYFTPDSTQNKQEIPKE